MATARIRVSKHTTRDRSTRVPSSMLSKFTRVLSLLIQLSLKDPVTRSCIAALNFGVVKEGSILTNSNTVVPA